FIRNESRTRMLTTKIRVRARGSVALRIRQEWSTLRYGVPLRNRRSGRMAKGLTAIIRQSVWRFALAAWAGGASAQAPTPAPDPGVAAPPRPRIPPPGRFESVDPQLGRVRISSASMTVTQDKAATPAMPTAAALPGGVAPAGAPERP